MRRRRSRTDTWPFSWVMGRMESARVSGSSRDSTKKPKDRGTQPVTQPGKGNMPGESGSNSLTGGAGHNCRAEENHRHKCAAFPGLTRARARCFPYLSPMNIPPFINRSPNKSPPWSALATSNYSFTCYLLPIWEQNPPPVLGKRLL